MTPTHLLHAHAATNNERERDGRLGFTPSVTSPPVVPRKEVPPRGDDYATYLADMQRLIRRMTADAHIRWHLREWLGEAE